MKKEGKSRNTQKRQKEDREKIDQISKKIFFTSSCLTLAS